MVVKTGYVGVKISWGRLVPPLLQPGLHFLNPLSDIVKRIKIREQLVTMRSLDCVSNDGSQVMFETLEIGYRINASHVLSTIDRYGFRYKEILIIDVARRNVANACNMHDVNFLKRSVFGELLRNAIQKENDLKKTGIDITLLWVKIPVISQVSANAAQQSFPHSPMLRNDQKVMPDVIQGTDSIKMNPANEIEPRFNQSLQKYLDASIQSNTSSTNNLRRKKVEVSVKYEFNDSLGCQNYNFMLDYIPESKMRMRVTPLLLSFRGPGSILLRLLIERITGYHSGSIEPNIPRISHIFHADSACGIRVSVVNGLYDSVLFKDDDKIHVGDRNTAKKCNRGLLPHFDRFILLVRNPFELIFATFRALHHETAEFSLSAMEMEWQAYARKFSRDIKTLFREIIRPIFILYPSKDVIVVWMEQLKDLKMRVELLRSISNFLTYPCSDFRLNCAFKLVDDIVDTRENKTKSISLLDWAYGEQNQR
jgi:hypothetical protein